MMLAVEAILNQVGSSSSSFIEVNQIIILCVFC